MTAPTSATLLALADRVEGATGADRELDAKISSILRIEDVPSWAQTWAGEWRATSEGTVVMMHTNGKDGPWFTAREWTASLDAAMGLVPEGWFWMAGNRDRLSPRAYVENEKPAFEGFSSRRNPERHWYEVTAATPALALTAAALRARAAIASAVQGEG